MIAKGKKISCRYEIIHSTPIPPTHCIQKPDLRTRNTSLTTEYRTLSRQIKGKYDKFNNVYKVKVKEVPLQASGAQRVPGS